MKIERLSSNSTLLLKIFLPVFWTIFFGALTLAFLVAEYQGNAMMHTLGFKLGVVVFYLLGLLAMYLTIWQLKRVEADENFVFVTDYFKTARYPFHNIQQIKSMVYPFINLGVVYFKEPGIFGKKIFFLHKQEAFERVVMQHPELMKKVEIEE